MKTKSNHHKWLFSGIVVVFVLLLIAIFSSLEWSSVGKASTTKCAGTIPTTAVSCGFGEEIGLTARASWHLVSSCTAAKCEYKCKEGYILDSQKNTCVFRPTTITPSDTVAPECDHNDPAGQAGTNLDCDQLTMGDKVFCSSTDVCVECNTVANCALYPKCAAPNSCTCYNNACLVRLPQATSEPLSDILDLPQNKYDLLNGILTIMDNEDTSFQKLSALAALIRENITLFE